MFTPCVVSHVRGMKELLESTGRRVPEDIGLAWQGVNPNHLASRRDVPLKEQSPASPSHDG